MHGDVALTATEHSSKRGWWRAVNLVDRARLAAARSQRVIVAQLAREERRDRQALRPRGDVPLARNLPLEIEHREGDGGVQREGTGTGLPLLRAARVAALGGLGLRGGRDRPEPQEPEQVGAAEGRERKPLPQRQRAVRRRVAFEAQPRAAERRLEAKVDTATLAALAVGEGEAAVRRGARAQRVAKLGGVEPRRAPRTRLGQGLEGRWLPPLLLGQSGLRRGAQREGPSQLGVAAGRERARAGGQQLARVVKVEDGATPLCRKPQDRPTWAEPQPPTGP